MRNHPFNIVCAGQCGTLLAFLLARNGFAVNLYERQVDPRVDDTQAGRSINLALAARGINALQHAGIYSAVEPLLVPMSGRMVHHLDGSSDFLRYGQHSDEQIYSVARIGLNKVLLDAAGGQDDVTMRFRQNAIGYDAPGRSVLMHDLDNDSQYEIDARPLISAEGAGSVVRRSVDGGDIFAGVETPLQHGYKELTVPPGPGGEFQLDPNALHIWPRGGFMLIALPNPAGDFTLTLFLPNEADVSFDMLVDKKSVEDFFGQQFADVAALIPNLASDVINRPLGRLGTVRCRHWHHHDQVLLIGDAAHAIVPFHGQGMNLAFEDCVLLDHVIRNHGSNWGDVFSRFEAEQLANANAIADMALDNYVEMRDTVREPKFALRNALAFELERSLPEHFIPRYSMVMFHADIPYQVARQRGEVQHALLEKFTQGAGKLADIDIDAAVAAALDQLPPIDTVRIDRRS